MIRDDGSGSLNPRRGIVRQVAVHACLVLFLVGEVFALQAQLMQLNFGGGDTARNAEGRALMTAVAFAFIVIAAVFGIVGRARWVAVVILMHAAAMLLWFNDGWGYTVVPTVVAVVVLWILWAVRYNRPVHVNA